ncbi:pilus assembly protein TadG-related protein [Pontixanthobacter gangjinensis]
MYAIALFGLITVAGVGWDYSRLMTMDSELQNAADQAALAAATQLTGNDGAMVRARDAANNYLASADSAWVNETKLSNDGDGRPITGLTFEFYEDYDRATDTFGSQVTNDDDAEDARVVRVIVNGRYAKYALTALTGVIRSPNIEANAVAGLEASVCKAPKMFVCAPTRDFPTEADKGKGFRLRVLPNATDAFTPGNFGFLDPDGSVKNDRDTGNPNRELGKNNELDTCVASSGIESEPGFVAVESRALNTRFDMYGPAMPGCNTTNGDFCPSENTVTTVVYKQEIPGNGSANPTATACASGIGSGNNARGSEMSLADALAEMTSTNNNTVPGYTRDNCMISGSCSTIGDGDWSGQAYMNRNHGAADLMSVSGDGSRFGVFQWELAAKSSRLAVRKLGYKQGTGGSNKSAIYCSYPQAVTEPPVVPSASQKDRRIMTVASVDCTGLNGRDKLDVLRFADLFLVDYSKTTGTNSGEIMTEVIGPARRPDGGSAFQYYGRNKPVLLR